MKCKKCCLAMFAIVASCGTGCSAPASDTHDKSPTQAEKSLTIAVVTHGSPGDPFWSVVKRGAEQAGKDLGVRVTYENAPDPVQQSQLIDAAVANHDDGLVVSMANPDGVKAAVEQAVHAGVPVITINSGGKYSRAFGALTHVGQSEYIAGQAAGRKLHEAGVRNLICVVHEAGNIGLESRCRGAADTLGGKVTNIQVDVANIADAQNVIRSKLIADPSIDGVLTLNPAVAVAASRAIGKARSQAKLATFDLSPDVLRLIEKGKVLFAVDQQPYLQGYLPVVFLTLHARNSNVVGGGRPVYSGPNFVTRANAAKVEQFASRGTR